jgi:hypothetical protein
MNPDSTNSPDEPLEAETPGFGPTSRPKIDPLDPAKTTTSPSPRASSVDPGPETPAADSRAAVDDLDEGPSAPTATRPDPGASSRSSGELLPEPPATVVEALAGLFGIGVALSGFVLNGTVGKGSGAYLVKPEENEAISQPLGRIAARRVPMGDSDSADVADGIEAGAAVIDYSVRATMEHFAGVDQREPGPETAAQ